MGVLCVLPFDAVVAVALRSAQGAGFFTNFYPLLWHYCTELGLTSTDLPSQFRDDGGAVTELSRRNLLVSPIAGTEAVLDLSAPLTLLRMPLLKLWHLLRFGIWVARLSCTRHRRDLVDPFWLARDDVAVGDGASGATAADDSRRSVGTAAYETLVRPGVESFWYHSCEEISRALTRALTAYALGVRFFVFRDGMDTLVKLLLSRPSNVVVHTSTAASRIAVVARDHSEAVRGAARRVDGANGPRVAVSFVDGRDAPFSAGGSAAAGETTRIFDGVVIATTADVASSLCRGLPRSSLSRDSARYLRTQRYAANIHAGFLIPKSALLQPITVTSVMPVGSAPLRSFDKRTDSSSEEDDSSTTEIVCDPHGQHILAATNYTSSKFGEESLLSGHEGVQVYLTHPASAAVLRQLADDDDHSTRERHLADVAYKYARGVDPALPSRKHAEAVLAVGRVTAIPVPEVGRYRQALQFDVEQRAPVTFAGDYCSGTATLEAALRSGLRAATILHEAGGR